MKTLRLLLLPVFGCFLILIANTAIAQTTDQNNINKELILGVPKLTNKTLDIVTNAIKQTEGLEFVQYCTSHQLILVRYDEKLFPARENVVRALEAQNVSMTMLIKEGNFEGVMELCQQ
jgi:hypothetical protein